MNTLINTKFLRSSLSTVIKKVGHGTRFTVLYRSHPAFQILPINAEEKAQLPLTQDPLYRAKPLVASGHPGSAKNHDSYLYPKRSGFRVGGEPRATGAYTEVREDCERAKPTPHKT